MLLALFAAALAGPYDDPVAQACVDRAHTQSQSNLCAAQEFARADKVLNAEYAALGVRMKADESFGKVGDGRPDGATLLRDSQRAWLKLRDDFCTLDAYHARGGSLELFIYERCRAEMTRERTAWLKRIAAPVEVGGE